jgi:sialate O-acetylesterase
MMARDGAALQGFAVAGADRHFRWAKASIEGDEVVVSSPDVPEPVAVRYAWGDSPICNLINKDGFPASPFRTDDWPGITAATLDVR